MKMVGFKPGDLINDTGTLGKKEIASSPNRRRTYDLPISTSDAQPMSYMRLVVASSW